MGRRQTFDLGTVGVGAGSVSDEVDLGSFTEGIAYLKWQGPLSGTGGQAAPWTVVVCWEFNPRPVGEPGEWYRQWSHDPLNNYQYTVLNGRQSDFSFYLADSGTKLKSVECPASDMGVATTTWNPQYTLDAKVPGRARLALVSTQIDQPFSVVLEAHQQRSHS